MTFYFDLSSVILTSEDISIFDPQHSLFFIRLIQVKSLSTNKLPKPTKIIIVFGSIYIKQHFNTTDNITIPTKIYYNKTDNGYEMKNINIICYNYNGTNFVETNQKINHHNLRAYATINPEIVGNHTHESMENKSG
jgi:hypothetical protein